MGPRLAVPNLFDLLVPLISVVVVLLLIAGAAAGVGYLLLLWLRNRGREAQSLDSTLIQVTLPRDNEVKIDAAEQFFASFVGIKANGMFSFLKYKPHIAFEIVGMPEDIRFYVYAPNRYKDLVEKQINASYPDAEIKEVDEKTSKEGYIVGNEYNIFSREGRVAFASFKLADSNYKPIKVFKDLAVDPMSSLTSVLAKMGHGEGAAIQLIISGADSTGVKKAESISPLPKRPNQIRKLPNTRQTPKNWKGLKIKFPSRDFMRQ